MPYLTLPTNQTVYFRQSSFVVGSDSSCDLPISGRGVAPRHLILQTRGEHWQVAPLAMSAPAAINDQPLTGLTILHDGDHIQVGEEIVLVWHEREQEEAKKGPWMGLLFILLVVVAMLTTTFAIYRFESNYLLSLPFITPQPTAIQAEFAPPQDKTLQPSGLSHEEHPVYQLSIPSGTE